MRHEPKGHGVVLALLILCVSAATPLRAQEYTLGAYGDDERRWVGATWVDDLGFTAINAVVSGVMGGITAVARDQGSFSDGFLQGSIGGVIVYGGKRLSAARFDGAHRLRHGRIKLFA
ncbi:MAG: hypothetical protein LC667_07980 [Thioalkalivibrio sp.]|nr:hypothetical protein [Thioalkalivibrio sp.]